MVLVDDVRHALRGLVHARRFALWIVASLSIGMAVTTAAFALLNALLVRPFPGVVDQDRLVRLALSRQCGTPDCWAPVAPAELDTALEEGLPGLASVASYTVADVPVGLPSARTMRTAFVSPRYFGVLGTDAALGRVLSPADDPDTPGAVIADRVWREAFSADPAVIGRPIRVADQFATIVGVAPPLFAGVDLRPARGDRGPDLWLPQALAERVTPSGSRGSPDVRIVGRLRAGVERAVVQAQAQVLATRLAAAATGSPVPGRAETTPVTLGNPRYRNLTIAIVLPIPVIVLLIACVNAAHLMLARAVERRREIAIRLAIGAGRA